MTAQKLSKRASIPLFFAIALAMSLILPLPATAQDFDPDKLSSSEKAKAGELLKEYRANKKDHAGQVESLKKMMELGRGVAVLMKPIIEREWRTAMPPYRKEFAKIASGFSAAKVERNRKEIAAHRATLKALRAKGKALSKEDTKGRGKAALEGLRKLFFTTKEEVLKASPELAKLRETAFRASEKKQIILERLVEDGDEAEMDVLKKFEDRLITESTPIPAEARQTLAVNRKTAVDASVPEVEAEGVYDLNIMRILAGLNALVLDPKLCEASRDHSKDMEEKGFFAHESPVPGKKTPWIRAKLVGTTASAENIAAGQSSPQGANMAWFYSPGHHINMFGGHRRVGLGKFKKQWTQMFGR